MKQLLPTQLQERIKSQPDLILIDVREKDEFSYANMGGLHIPLSELSNSINQLNPMNEFVVICHHGIRSAQAVRYLNTCGFDKVYNLTGGIDRWSLDVDPQVPRY